MDIEQCIEELKRLISRELEGEGELMELNLKDALRDLDTLRGRLRLHKLLQQT